MGKRGREQEQWLHLNMYVNKAQMRWKQLVSKKKRNYKITFFNTDVHKSKSLRT